MYIYVHTNSQTHIIKLITGKQKWMALTRQRWPNSSANTLKADQKAKWTGKFFLAKNVHNHNWLLWNICSSHHPIQPKQHSKPCKSGHQWWKERKNHNDKDDAVIGQWSERFDAWHVQYETSQNSPYGVHNAWNRQEVGGFYFGNARRCCQGWEKSESRLECGCEQTDAEAVEKEWWVLQQAPFDEFLLLFVHFLLLHRKTWTNNTFATVLNPRPAP